MAIDTAASSYRKDPASQFEISVVDSFRYNKLRTRIGLVCLSVKANGDKANEVDHNPHEERRRETRHQFPKGVTEPVSIR